MTKKKNRRKPRRSSSQLIRDRRQIATLYLLGELQADIAEKVGLAQSTVSRDIQALHKKWLLDANRDFDEAKATEIAKIDNLEMTYHDAWMRSKEDAVTVTVKEYQDGETETTTVTKGQVGDSRFLSGIHECIDKRCKIFGLNVVNVHVQADWQGEALEKGLNPDELFELFVSRHMGKGEGEMPLLEDGEGKEGKDEKDDILDAEYQELEPELESELELELESCV